MRPRVDGQRNRQAIIDALPGTQRQLAERTGLVINTVSSWLVNIVEAREAHISRYDVAPRGGKPRATYTAGPRPERFKPRKPRFAAPRSRATAYRRQLMKTGEWEEKKAHRRALYHLRKPVRQRDPLMNALFGNPHEHPRPTD